MTLLEVVRHAPEPVRRNASIRYGQEWATIDQAEIGEWVLFRYDSNYAAHLAKVNIWNRARKVAGMRLKLSKKKSELSVCVEARDAADQGVS